MPRCNKLRLRRLLAVSGGLLLAGLGYALVYDATGFSIPCPFYAVTGLQCPGCGVSRMCLCLLHLDFSGAWHYNPVILSLLPVGIILAVRLAARYVKTGSKALTKGENATLWAMIVILLLFGVIRNLPFYPG